MNIVYQEKWDRRISFYIIFFFIISSLNSVIKLLIPLSESLWAIISISSGVLIVLPMLYCIRVVYGRAKNILLLSVLFFATIYILSILLSLLRNEPVDLILKGTAFLTFAWWIPIGVFAYSVTNKKILYEILLKGSYFISILLSIPFIFFLMGLLPGYNMFFAYALILPLLLHINEYICTKKRVLLVVILLEFTAIVLFGSRGPLICLLIYLLSKLIDIKSLTKRILIFFTIAFLALIGKQFMPIVVESAAKILLANEIQSRTINKLATGSISDNTNRTEIWSLTLDMISERPIFGWGLGGEYYTLGKRFGDHIIDNSSTPHNGILQLWVNFGVFLGSGFILFIILPYFQIFKIKDYYLKSLLLIFFSIGVFPKLFISSGFFIAPEVAIYLFLYLFYKKKLKQKTYLAPSRII